MSAKQAAGASTLLPRQTVSAAVRRAAESLSGPRELAIAQRRTMPPLRVLLHDYGGYGFIAQLARELAGRGHEVHHVHFASLRSGKGSLTDQPTDPRSLTFDSIEIERDFDRYQIVDRVRLERTYAQELAHLVTSWRPDVVVSANTPLLVLHRVLPHLARAGIPLVNWLQDLHSVAIGNELVRRFEHGTGPAAAALELLEARLLRSCAAVVTVTPDFLPVLKRWHVPTDRVTVVPNWAELSPLLGRHNQFSSDHDLDGRVTLLYAGTLGLKHEPIQLVRLAEAFRDRPDVKVVVVSEGLGREWLETECRARRLDNLVLVDFQPSDRVSDVLGSGDVLVSMIRAEAGRFSVPSKILAYLAAGRAQLAAIPHDNLAARVLHESGSGVVVEPGAADDWTTAARQLVDDPEWRRSLGNRGRAYAETHFDVGLAADAFETVLAKACADRPGGRSHTAPTNPGRPAGAWVERLHGLADVVVAPGGVTALRTWRPFSLSAFRLVRALHDDGLSFSTVIDVGANAGQFARASIGHWPDAKVIAFEPLPGMAARLGTELGTPGQVEPHAVALGARDAMTTFYPHGYSLSSSALRVVEAVRHEPWASEDGPISVPLKRLDTILAARVLDGPVLLKIDVQGFELEVLTGAQRILRQVHAIVVETAFEPQYVGQPPFAQVHHALEGWGWRLVRPLMFRKEADGRVVEADWLYLKDKGSHAALSS